MKIKSKWAVSDLDTYLPLMRDLSYEDGASGPAFSRLPPNSNNALNERTTGTSGPLPARAQCRFNSVAAVSVPETGGEAKASRASVHTFQR
jgi:hypothetical protein